MMLRTLGYEVLFRNPSIWCSFHRT